MISIFPCLCLFALTILSALGISGTSAGMYAGGQKDPDLIAGRPRPIRHDEWGNNVPALLLQWRNSYPLINEHKGTGMNMSLLFDVPVTDWSEAFRPQNWAFHVLPFEQAFAFRWWLMAVGVALSMYWLVLSLAPSRVVTAALLGISLLFSPFLQWWYVSATLGCVAYTLALAAIISRCLRTSDRRSAVAYAGGAAYLTTCFALLLYPPFQIPCFVALVGFSIGHLIYCRSTVAWAQLLRRLGLLVSAGAVAIVVTGAFFVTRIDAIRTMMSTVYPGTRSFPTGGFPARQLLSGFLDRGLLNDRIAMGGSGYGGNQSESSMFILVAPFLVLPVAWSLLVARRRAAADWSLLGSLVAIATLAAVMCVPGLDFLVKVLFLDSSPHQRLMIGIGTANALMLAGIVGQLDRVPRKMPWQLITVSTGVTLWVFAGVAEHFRRINPPFAGSHTRSFLMALTLTAVVALLHCRRTLPVAATVLMVFSVWSCALVNPLYRGLKILNDMPAVKAIRKMDQVGPGAWITNSGSLVPGEVLTASGVQSYGGTYPYPDKKLWREFDSRGEYAYVWNRYGMVVWSDDLDAPFKLLNPDVFAVRFDACSAFVQRHVRYVLADKAINSPCVKFRNSTHNPVGELLIYELIKR